MKVVNYVSTIIFLENWSDRPEVMDIMIDSYRKYNFMISYLKSCNNNKKRSLSNLWIGNFKFANRIFLKKYSIMNKKITRARLRSLLFRPSGENDFMIGNSPSSIEIVNSCRACPGKNFRFPCRQIPLFNSVVRSGI